MQKNLVRKGLAVGIILLFVATIIIPSNAQNIEKSTLPTSRGNWLYVGGSGPGNYTTIQSAINAANPGDTVFVYNGTYYENVEVNKNNITLVGENKDTTIIDGGGTLSVVYVSLDGVIISGFTVQKGSFGIALDGSSNNIITGNNVLNNKYGIYISGSSNNIITGNTINSSNHYGIFLDGSSNNNIISNTICSSENHGLQLVNSPNTLMRNNSIQNSKHNFGVVGGGISNFYQDIDITNTVNGKPIYYLVEQSNLEFDDSMSVGYIGLISCKNISVKNLILTQNQQGLLLVNTSYSIINNLHLYNNSLGIHLLFSSNNNIITGNNASSNIYDGIAIISSSNNNITRNDANSNTYDGILVYHSNSNNITGNNINSNNNDGINLQSSSNNIITGNNANSNNGSGIYLSGSNSNNITGNNINSNNLRGISLYSSSNNTFLKNNFLRNKRHVLFYNCKNTWSRNYWERSRILPKLIFGTIEIKYRKCLWCNIDWRPALRPYDIL